MPIIEWVAVKFMVITIIIIYINTIQGKLQNYSSQIQLELGRARCCLKIVAVWSFAAGRQ